MACALAFLQFGGGEIVNHHALVGAFSKRTAAISISRPVFSGRAG
jgi:hypothetical protein